MLNLRTYLYHERFYFDLLLMALTFASQYKQQ